MTETEETEDKRIIYDEEAREQLRSGVQTLAKAVKSTLGPRGRNVVLAEDFGTPNITKDGVSVAEEIELEGKFRNMGAQIVKQAATSANDQSGDGTTTATVIAEKVFLEGMKSIVAGTDPNELRRGIERSIEQVIRFLKDKSTPIDSHEKIKQIATIAANNDPEIGEKLAEAMDQAGEDGVVTIEEGKGLETTVETVEGMEFDRGYLSPYFVTDEENRECVLEEPLILLYEDDISNMQELLPLVEKVNQTDKPLLIIAENVEGEALSTLVVNKMRDVFTSAAVKAPGYGDRRKQMLQDLAVLTGGSVIWEETGMSLEDVSIDQLGTAKKVVIDQDSTTMIEGAGSTEAIEQRVQQIRNKMDSSDSDYDREKLEERLGKLAGGVARINVGAATDVEIDEREDLVEDALHAVRSAMDEGIVPGGGVSLLRAAQTLDKRVKGLSEEQKIGRDIVKRALEAPAVQIADNAGLAGNVVKNKILEEDEFEFGFNAKSREYGDLVEMGVIDPTRVVAHSLQFGATTAYMMLITDALISMVDEDAEEEQGQPGAGGMGGMGGMGGGMGMGGMGMGGMGGGMPM